MFDLSLYNPQIVGNGLRTVVLGTGFGTEQTCWHSLVETLVAQDFRAVTFDFAGATEHSRPAFQPQRHCSLYGFAEDLVALMKSLQIRGATYVGHSLAGMVGVLACNDDAGLFDSLVLVGSSARYLDDPGTGYIGGFSQAEMDQLLAGVQNDFAAWANGFAQLIVGPDHPGLALDFSRSLRSMRPDMALTILTAIFLSDHRRDVTHIQVPVQVLQTAIDAAVPLPAAQWLVEHLHARDFTVIPTQGHLPHITAAREVNAAILKFLHTHVER